MCSLCGKQFSHKSGFKRHFIDLHYTPGVRYFCPACKRIYKNRNSMVKHVSVTHKTWKKVNYNQLIYKEENQDESKVDLKC